MTPLARTAGHALALTAVALALAAGAQTQVVGAHAGGLAPWIFAGLVAAAIAGVFLFVLWVVRPPARAPGERPRAVQHR
jgi:hypothetical protein